jgi:hypothetical protein
MMQERGVVYVPVHGLVCAHEAFDFAGLSFRRVPPDAWRMLEPNWIADQYADRYAAAPRIFVVAEIEAEQGALLTDESLVPIKQRYTAFVTAARLAARGALVDWHRVCPVLRIGSQNQRLAGAFRNRLWGAMFEEPRMGRGRRREFGDRVEWRPPQALFPHELPYELTDDVVELIAPWLHDLERLRATADGARVLRLIRDFERAQDPLFHARARLLCVLAAFEALFGSFMREDRDVGVGVAVSRVLQRAGIEPNDSASYVESILREERNRLAHGADVKRPLDIARMTAELSALLRIGLTIVCKWIIEAPPGERRTVQMFRRDLRSLT